MFALTFLSIAAVLIVHITSVRAHGVVQEVVAERIAYTGYLHCPDPHTNPIPECMTAPAGSTSCFNWTDCVRSHVVPVLTLMAPDPNDSDTTSYSPGAYTVSFKTAKEGMNDDGKWVATDLHYDDKNVVSATIPEAFIPGEYIVHQETIALHQATSLAVQVHGEDLAADDLLVSLRGAYKPKTPGNVYGMYTDTVSSDYPIPGPRVWTA